MAAVGYGPDDKLSNILPHLEEGDSAAPKSSRKKSRRNTHIACVNCSRWHVSCEAKRPCHRCVSKGLESSCIDAPRKKSKYLAGVPNTSLVRSVHRDNGTLLNNNNGCFLDNNGSGSYVSLDRHEQQKFRDPRHIDHKSRFLSNAADSEYSILSDIINQDTLMNRIPIDLLYSEKSNNMSTVDTGISVPDAVKSRDVYSMLLGRNSQEILTSRVDLFQNHFPLTPIDSQDKTLAFSTTMDRDKCGSVKVNASINQYYLNRNIRTFPEVVALVLNQQASTGNNKMISFTLECVPPDVYQISSNSEWEHSLRYSNSMEIYRYINEPFSHTPGFHHLYIYLRRRFIRKDLIEMCGCLAEFRPIFIACTASLTEQDMIFMEQCYQRTLLEYAKFIVQIGTPTCVWRRNGQISYVNEEFEILSGWNREQLLNKMTFIVEIMDDQSVRDYFKTFANVAYKDFKGSETMKTCNILTPTRGQVISCCCMWTLKRDVSGLPLMILGNFMPILW